MKGGYDGMKGGYGGKEGRYGGMEGGYGEYDEGYGEFSQDIMPLDQTYRGRGGQSTHHNNQHQGAKLNHHPPRQPAYEHGEPQYPYHYSHYHDHDNHEEDEDYLDVHHDVHYPRNPQDSKPQGYTGNRPNYSYQHNHENYSSNVKSLEYSARPESDYSKQGAQYGMRFGGSNEPSPGSGQPSPGSDHEGAIKREMNENLRSAIRNMNLVPVFIPNHVLQRFGRNQVNSLKGVGG